MISTKLIGHLTELTKKRDRENDKKNKHNKDNSSIWFSTMRSRNDLGLEMKVNLIRDKECELSHRELKDRFQLSVDAITNILKRKYEYISDYKQGGNS